MARLLQRLLDWIRHRPRQVVVVLGLGAVAMQLPLWLWYVDDAAISIAFANHLVAGEGLVAYPGGERVEGYSNPLWVLLIAAGRLVGMGGFATVRVLGCLCAAATVPLVVALASRARPDRSAPIPLLAGLLLVTSAPFAIWNASGLENALFDLLLAGGALRLLIESERAVRPWSALLFFGISITRPEGFLYAAVAAFFAFALPLRAGRGLRPGLVWAAAFLLPFAAYHAARFRYFAWPLPNTYYAKLGEGATGALEWNGRGWTYLRSYAGLGTYRGGPGLGLGYLLPVPLLGVLGRRHGRVGLAVLGLFAVALLAPPPTEITGWHPLRHTPWPELRAGLLVAAAALATLLALARGRAAAALLAALAAAAAAFSVLARGDWMAGYRLLAMAQVPLAVLFALGVGEIVDSLEERGRRGALAVALVLGAVYIAPQIRSLVWFTSHAVTSPKSVKRRVDYWKQVSETLQLEDPTLLDVDMGATMLWSDTPIVDIAGLVDVPIAHHHYDRRFLREYVLLERNPELVHLHKGWAHRTKLMQLPEWDERYFEIPGYPIRIGTHRGNHVRRDLLFAPSWPGGTERARELEGELSLVGFEIGPAGPGGRLPLHLALARDPDAAAPERGETRIEVRLADDRRIAARALLAPAHGWLPPKDWREGEIFTGRYAIPIPEETAPGRYDLLLRPVVVVDGEESPGAEVRFPGAAEVVRREVLERRRERELRAALERAADGACEEAADGWAQLRATAETLRQRDAPVPRRVRAALAECWARRAGETPRRDDAVRLLARARALDHHSATLARVRAPIADALYREGLAARQRALDLRRSGSAAEELAAWEVAYARMSDLLRIDASRSRARRYAEEARAQRLGLIADSARERADAHSRGAMPERKTAKTAA
jgi:hypothetical protein